jgi:hypothetical protein
LFAVKDLKVGEPILAVPHDMFMGRAYCDNQKLITLTDRLYPRGSPPLRPLKPEEILKESDPTMTNFAPKLQLAVLLTMEFANNHSKFRPWLEVMPRPLLESDSTPQALTRRPAKKGSILTTSDLGLLRNAPFLEPQLISKLFQQVRVLF